MSISAIFAAAAFIMKSCSKGVTEGGRPSRAASTPRSRPQPIKPQKTRTRTRVIGNPFPLRLINSFTSSLLTVEQKNNEQDQDDNSDWKIHRLSLLLVMAHIACQPMLRWEFIELRRRW